MLSAVLRVSITELTRRRARTLSAVATLALAVASIGIFAVPSLIDRAMQDEVRVARLADLTVFTRPLVLDASELAALERLPNIEAVEPRSFFATRVWVGGRREEASVIGVPDFGGQEADVVRVASGSAPGPGELLTETRNAQEGRLEAGPGDEVRLLDAGGATRTLPIVGEGHNLDRGTDVYFEREIVLYAALQTVAALSGHPGYSGLGFQLRDTSPGAVAATLSAVRRRLEAEPGFGGFTELPETRAPGDWPGKEEFGQFLDLFNIITILALLSALVLMSSTMSTLVGEQTHEIGVMKAVGARRRQIAAVFLRTALLLGALGALAGVLLGLVVANGLTRFFGSEFFAVDAGFAIDVPILVASLLIGLAWPALSAVPAIRRGVRVPAREAIEATGSTIGGHAALDRALRHVGGLPRVAQIGLRGVARRTRRSVSTALQVALAVATLLAILGLGAAGDRATRGAWDEHGEDISVWAPSGRPLDARAGRLLAAVPGVAAVEPVLKNEALLGDEDAFIWGLAQGTMFHHHVTGGRWYTAGEERGRERVAVVERDIARRTGTGVGDVVRVTTAAGPVALRIVGVTANLQENGSVLFVPITTTRALLGDADGYEFSIATASSDEAQIDRTTTRAEDALSAAGYQPSTEITHVAKADEVARNRMITTTITVLGFLIVAIGMVGLAGALTMSVLERTREIGILRSIGARGRDVRWIFATEGMVLALLGWTVGVPLGYALDHLLIRLVQESLGLEIGLEFPLWNLPLALAGTLVLTLVIMLAPLRRAVSLRPGEALRYG